MKKAYLWLVVLLTASAACAASPRVVTRLADGWRFNRGETFDSAAARPVRVPHDWAIYGPFDRANDLQTVAVAQNGETRPSAKTGRTGGLPFIGKGVYRTVFNVADIAGRAVALEFDGVMSHARVRVNGREMIYWPYGYNSFHVDVTDAVRPGANLLEVSCENRPGQSRWYPGAGIYRNVRVVETDRVHIPVWGTRVETPLVSDTCAVVRLTVEVSGARDREPLTVSTVIIGPDGREVAGAMAPFCSRGQDFVQSFAIDAPRLWSPDAPALYTARTSVSSADGRLLDSYDTRFGLRRLDFIPDRGFYLNGRPAKFRGVCNHHDLGPLGAAVNRSALRQRLEMLKDMGANAIRTAHNMPSPELVELCDEMGLMLMVEPFDDWGYRPKSPNGYGAVFDQWAERDIYNMVKHYRNNPSVVMWSIGNEVPSQWADCGMAELLRLRDAVRSLDTSRPITCGMDQVAPGAVVDNGFAAALDIPGFNYKPQYYDDFHRRLPAGLILGSETASTVSSRGKYHFPVTFRDHNVVMHTDHQSSSYDNESCAWSNTPDLDFARDDDHPWCIGQFVWTGFDYLGEPSPYDTDAWPSHSSLFGIIDLASLPKDRYYLYRSRWNETDPTLHILPHWTWPGREGEVTPVFVYTSWPRAELFVNGVSQGVREKNDSTLYTRCRLMWNDVKYTPGELRVVASDAAGRPAGESRVRTAGPPAALRLTPRRASMPAGGDELVYVTVEVVDRDGVPVPQDGPTVKFAVSGAGSFEAVANGDPTSLADFYRPEIDLFSGAATVILRAGADPGTLRLRASARGLKPADISIEIF